MQVVKKGQIPEEREFEATCHRCKSVLCFRQAEGKVTHDQREGSFVTVACPVCGHSVHASLSGR